MLVEDIINTIGWQFDPNSVILIGARTGKKLTNSRSTKKSFEKFFNKNVNTLNACVKSYGKTARAVVEIWVSGE